MSVFQLAASLSPEHLASLIHKLRGPLAAISAHAETMAEGILGPLNPPQAEAVRSIRQELNQSLHQIETLEELWLPGQALETDSTSPSELPELFQRVTHEFAAQLENRQITFHLDTSSALPACALPPARLQRLLQHLLTCQIALVPKGMTLHLHFSSLPAEARSIKEHPAVQTQLVRLEPFGLLVLTRSGELFIQNHPATPPTLGLRLADEWSCWISVLPSEPPTSSHSSTLLPSDANAPLILLADDQDTLANVLGNYLQDLGYRVEKASDGLEVVRLARQLRPNLILMDLRMPLLSGTEALRQIREDADEITRAIPIVCMSGFATPEEEARCLAAGANAFLRKPFRPAELQPILNQAR